MSWSSNATVVTREASDSNSRTEACHGACTTKRRRFHPSSYKGVVVQPNGNWGAQIYFNNERIWLGTFKSERDAGMAYDSAALKLRGDSDFDRNFPWTSLTVHEPRFQSRFTTEAVLNMIKDGSYPSRFAHYVTTRGEPDEIPKPTRGYPGKELFQKELTPSDVGKLNRLVIPKKAAVRFFPPVPDTEEVQLTFHDRSMRVWRFRYCYWKSSQSFVFTRGWNRFVSVNCLRSRDVVTFWRCEWRGTATDDGSGFYVIEAGRRDETGDVDEPVNRVETTGVGSGSGGDEKDEDGCVEGKGFKLFGVQIL